MNYDYSRGSLGGKFSKDCSLDSTFLIDCNETSSTHTPFLPRSNHGVLNISLNGELRVAWPVASNCYDGTGKVMNQTNQDLELTHFHLSSSRNKLIAIGCDTTRAVRVTDSEGKDYATGCVSLCFSLEDNNIGARGSCSGFGCCEISIPQGHGLWKVIYNSGSTGLRGKPNLSPCSYAFPVEDGAYNFASTGRLNLSKTEFPVVLDWAVGNQTCQQARKQVSTYACKADNSECHDATDRPGYLCKCSHGFGGNPYLPHGCQDIDECKESSDDCVYGAKCINVPWSYRCKCPRGYDGDGKKNGTRCNHKSRTDIILIIALVVLSSLVSIALLIGLQFLKKVARKRMAKKRKENFFKKNGGLLLEQRISSGQVNVDTSILFSLKDLKKATDNFSMNRVLGKSGQGTVYKGMLVDGRIVAVKKFKVEGKVEEFVNEFVIISQINNRNVVKLLGCRLETEIPLLVYEFITNGNLYEYLHNQNEDLPMTWDMRLRIATEIAGALFYLHSVASQPIYHKDIKSTNILLDEKYRAKLVDFGASKINSIEATHLTTVVQGTFEYLDPEYFHTSQFTEKSDVYRFGVVLAELLTGQKPISSTRFEKSKNLASYFTLSMEENQLFDIIDERVMKEGEKEHIITVANLAHRCLELNGRKRPTMKEVTLELERVHTLNMKSNEQPNHEEIGLVETQEYQPWVGYSRSNSLPTLSSGTLSSNSGAMHILALK